MHARATTLVPHLTHNGAGSSLRRSRVPAQAVHWSSPSSTKQHPDALQDLEHLRVPRTIPGLVTQRVLIMTFLPGEQITHLQVCAALLSLFSEVVECKVSCPSCGWLDSVSGGRSAPAVVCVNLASKVWSAVPLLQSALKSCKWGLPRPCCDPACIWWEHSSGYQCLQPGRCEQRTGGGMLPNLVKFFKSPVQVAERQHPATPVPVQLHSGAGLVLSGRASTHAGCLPAAGQQIIGRDLASGPVLTPAH